MKTNANIEALIKQSSEEMHGWDERRGNYSITHFDKDKFAELLIKECVKVGTTAFKNDNGVLPVFPSSAIKKHFGIKA